MKNPFVSYLMRERGGMRGRLKFGEIYGEFFFFSAFRIDNLTNSGPKFKSNGGTLWNFQSSTQIYDLI